MLTKKLPYKSDHKTQPMSSTCTPYDPTLPSPFLLVKNLARLEKMWRAARKKGQK